MIPYLTTAGASASPPPGDGQAQGEPERAPSPPPLSEMDKVQGYENVNFQAGE